MDMATLTTILTYAVPALLIVVFFVLKHFGIIKYVTTANEITDFIKKTLISMGITTEDSNFSKILGYIVEALTFVTNECDSSISTEEKVDKATDLIKEYLTKAGITFTDSQIVTIRLVLVIGFNYFVRLAKADPKFDKHIKTLNKKMAAQRLAA